jgi:hypothetical protein
MVRGTRLLLVKRALFAALAILLIDASGARPQTTPPPNTQPIPSTEQLIVLVRNILLAVNDANLTGNYTVLRDLSAPDAQALNSPERLEESFRAIRQQGIDLSIVAVATPRFVQLPTITPQGYLRLNGEFNSAPRVTFDLFLQNVAGRWRPYAIGVGIVAVPLAPPPAVEATAPPKANAVAPRKPKPSKPQNE